jgi:hypothetical protein
MSEMGVRIEKLWTGGEHNAPSTRCNRMRALGEWTTRSVHCRSVHSRNGRAERQQHTVRSNPLERKDANAGSAPEIWAAPPVQKWMVDTSTSAAKRRRARSLFSMMWQSASEACRGE